MRWLESPTFYAHSSLGSASGCTEDSSASWRNDFNCAVSAWNNVGSATIAMSVTTDSEWVKDDIWDENDVAFLDESEFDPDDLAVTWYQWICGCCVDTTIEEADIGFNDKWSSWVKGPSAPDMQSVSPSSRSFRATALHEIGHAVGLSWDSFGGHEDDELATMNSKYPSGGWYRGSSSSTGRIWPHADDAEGLHWLNPDTAVGRDLAVARTKVGSAGSAQQVSPVTPNSVCAGNTVQLQYTVENRGNETLSGVYVKAYFSTSKWIDPSTAAGSTSLGSIILTPYAWATYTKTSVTVPSTLTPATYYVGVYIDPANTFTGEASNINNNGIHLPVVNSSASTLTVTAPCP